MNDNWSEGWRGNVLGIGFRVLGILLFAGGCVGGIYYPNLAWGLLCIGGFAMVMV